MCRKGQGSGPSVLGTRARESALGLEEAPLGLMAFLVSGTLQAAAQLADAWDTLGRQVVGYSAWPNPFPMPSWASAQHSSDFPSPRENTGCRVQG